MSPPSRTAGAARHISHSTVVLCIEGWPWFGQHYSVLKEILMITFSLW